MLILHVLVVKAHLKGDRVNDSERMRSRKVVQNSLANLYTAADKLYNAGGGAFHRPKP